ncbi:hypothetical protein LTR16_010808, partial [Cryomyces antarcticus]
VVLTGAHYGAVLTATDARGSTFITTYTPGGGAISSLVLYTTVLPNGQRSTITSFALVGAPTSAASSSAPVSSASRTGTAAPGLQSGMAAGTRVVGMELAALVGGAVGVAWFL